MKKFIASNRLFVCFLLALALCWSALATSVSTALAHEVDDEEFPDFHPIAISISNNQFSETSGSLPATPTSWSGSALGGLSSAGITSGVITLTASSYQDNRKNYNMDSFFDVGEFPRSPFGEKTAIGQANFPGTTKNALLINTHNLNTAYGYTSSSFNLTANRTYLISAWVKTGDFANNTGATIRLNGLADTIAFEAISTYGGAPSMDTAANNFNWREYRFFVQTGFVDSTCTLTLAVGDGDTGSERPIKYPANGYALFDNIVAQEISPILFDTLTEGVVANNTNPKYAAENDRIEIRDASNFVYSLQSQTSDADMMVTNGDFANGIVGWDLNPEHANHNANYTVLSAEAFPTVNPYNLQHNPRSPSGAGNYLLLSTYNQAQNRYLDGAIALESQPLLVKRNTYYRISAWVKTHNAENGDGANIRIMGQDNRYHDDDSGLDVSATNLAGDSNAAHYGWVEQAFFVRGSSLNDRQIRIVLGLGNPAASQSTASGTAMFADIRVQDLTASQFAEHSANGQIVTFEESAATTVANGRFATAGDYTEYKYPLPVADWTLVNGDNTDTHGWSNNAVNVDNVISGLVCTDAQHYANNIANYGNVVNPIIDSRSTPNLLLMQSSTPTAFCYRSSALTIDANTTKRVTVSMMVQAGGYGASLVLKRGNRVMTTIENIQSTDGHFYDYNFYVEAGSTAINDVTVEIWLGLADRTVNQTKLGNGHILVKEVSLGDLFEGQTFQALSDEYYDYVRNSTATMPTFAVFGNAVENFHAFDVYQPGALKTAYDWTYGAQNQNTLVTPVADANTITHGIFDASSLTAGGGIIPADFAHDDVANPFVMLYRHVAPTASKLTSQNSYALTASSYYTLTVRMKVDLVLESTSVGAGILLDGSSFGFADIRDTARHFNDGQVDNSQYRDFVFYIKTGDADSTVSVSFTLGGAERSNQFATGSLYISSIILSPSDADVFEAETQDIELVDDTNLNKDGEYVYKMRAILSDTTADTETDETAETADDIQWWLIPSVLFSVAIIIALLGVVMRKLTQWQNAKSRPKLEAPTYDRNRTAVGARVADDQIASVDMTSDMAYDTFEEVDSTPAQPVRKQRPAVVTAPVVTTTEADQADALDEVAATVDTEASAPEQPAQSAPADAYLDQFED